MENKLLENRKYFEQVVKKNTEEIFKNVPSYIFKNISRNNNLTQIMMGSINEVINKKLDREYEIVELHNKQRHGIDKTTDMYGLIKRIIYDAKFDKKEFQTIANFIKKYLGQLYQPSYQFGEKFKKLNIDIHGCYDRKHKDMMKKIYGEATEIFLDDGTLLEKTFFSSEDPEINRQLKNDKFCLMIIRKIFKSNIDNRLILKTKSSTIQTVMNEPSETIINMIGDCYDIKIKIFNNENLMIRIEKIKYKFY